MENQMQIDAKALFSIIGQKEFEIYMLRERVNNLSAALATSAEKASVKKQGKGKTNEGA